MSASSEENGLKYNQVVFTDVPPSYPPNTDVTCSYMLTGGLTHSTKHWIGIYKIGWESVQKYYCYERTNPCLDKENKECEQQIVFKQSYLPRDDGEFYQFCYVDNNSRVCGMSTPFSFENAEEETSEDYSLLVISTQEQVEHMEQEKEALLAKIKDLEDGEDILKNELGERLQEIHRLRMYIEKLKSDSRSETLPLKEQPESPWQHTLEPSFRSDSVAETKTEQESLTPAHEKYEKAVRKISFLKQEKEQLEKQVMKKDAEISELRPMAKKTEQEYNKLQDQFQLQQVDMQNTQKDRERLCAEIEGLKCDRERLEEENKALNATVSKQGPPEGDKSDVKMQILYLTRELGEVRVALRKEIQNSVEANKRADKAELQLKELKVQLEKKTEKSPTEMEIVEACKRNRELVGIAEVVQLENETLLKENKKLKDDIERFQSIIVGLSEADVSNTHHHQNPFSPLPAAPINTQQQAQLDTSLYENIGRAFENPTNAGNQEKVCRHCRESFPNITEHELATHEQSHKTCPFCTLICDDLGQEEFENHVYSHEE